MPKELRPGSSHLDTVVHLVCSARMEAGAGWSLETGVFWRGRNPEPSFGGSMKFSEGRAFGQLESVTGGAGHGSLSLMRRRVSLAETTSWDQFGSILSVLE